MQAYRWQRAWTWVLLFSSTQSGRTAERSCCLGPVRCRRVMGSLGDLPAAGLPDVTAMRCDVQDVCGQPQPGVCELHGRSGADGRPD